MAPPTGHWRDPCRFANNSSLVKSVLPSFKWLFFCVAGELLSQPRPEGLTEIVCPKNGSERVNVALVYPPMPTVLSPSLKWPGNVDRGLFASPNLQGRFQFSVFFQAFFTWLHHAASNPRPPTPPPPLHLCCATLLTSYLQCKFTCDCIEISFYCKFSNVRTIVTECFPPF